MPGAPAWYLGTVGWNGRTIPVISFEGTLGHGIPTATGRTRIVVFHCLADRLTAGNFGIITQGFPQLVGPEGIEGGPELQGLGHQQQDAPAHARGRAPPRPYYLPALALPCADQPGALQLLQRGTQRHPRHAQLRAQLVLPGQPLVPLSGLDALPQDGRGLRHQR